MSNKVRITRHEYLKALTLIEAYRQQIAEHGKDFDDGTKSILLKDWLEIAIISSRLRNVLNKCDWDTVYLEDINFHIFLRLRNAGKRSWQEFIAVREKYYQQYSNV
jgi:hypothetical protein